MLARRTIVTSIVCMAVPGGLLCAPPASAEVSGSVAIATDYIQRGVSRTGGQPAAQAGIQFDSTAGWHAGLWGSSVDFRNDAGAAYELDLLAGYSWPLSPDWTMQLGYVHYAYLSDADTGYDYDEVTASINFQQRATASVSWSPNTSRRTYTGTVREGQAIAYELSLLQPLRSHWAVHAGVGYFDLRDLVDAGYWYWSTGIAFSWDAVQVDLLHIDTDSTATRLFDSGSRWTAALTWRF